MGVGCLRAFHYDVPIIPFELAAFIYDIRVIVSSAHGSGTLNKPLELGTPYARARVRPCFIAYPTSSDS